MNDAEDWSDEYLQGWMDARKAALDSLSDVPAKGDLVDRYDVLYAIHAGTRVTL